jgi:hypothetical protein
MLPVLATQGKGSSHMSVGVLRRYAVPVTVALPIALAGLVAGDGGLPSPFHPDDSTVRTVTAPGGLGIQDRPPDPRLPDPSDATGAHPVTYPVGTSAVRQAATREEAPGPDTTDLALPARVLQAYQAAARDLRRSDAACHLDWPLLAGIGKVESGHAYGGEVDRRGDTLEPILGPVLDGGPGVAAIPDTDDGRWDTDDTWDRAVGPMQFIPSSWTIHGEDANHDGRRDPNNVNDASLASAGYLCSGDRDVSERRDRRQAVFSYNHSWDYVDLVLAWADAYAGGTPVLTGSLAMALDDPTARSKGGDGPGAGSSTGDHTAGEVAAMPPPSAAAVAEPTASADAGGSSPASTPEPTASGDPGQTADPTPSETSEPTSSASATPAQPCPTSTPSETASPSDSATATPSDSATAAPTDSATATPTETPEPSATSTPDPGCP